MEKKRERVDPVRTGTAVYDDSSLDLPPPVYHRNKKSKINEEAKNKERGSDSDSDIYIDSDDEYCREMDAYIYRFKDQTMDTINAVKMLYDIHDMLELRVDAFIFASFIQHSNYRNCLNYFDAYGDRRCGGFYHINGCNLHNRYVKPAKFALDYYSTHCNPDAKFTFVKLEKVSCCPQGDYFYYVTFRARDEVADVERIYQALVLEYKYDDYYYAKYAASADKDDDCAKHDAVADVNDANYILGMLRVKDPIHDHVLAIIQLKPGVNHEDVMGLYVKRYNEGVTETDL